MRNNFLYLELCIIKRVEYVLNVYQLFLRIWNDDNCSVGRSFRVAHRNKFWYSDASTCFSIPTWIAVKSVDYKNTWKSRLDEFVRQSFRRWRRCSCPHFMFGVLFAKDRNVSVFVRIRSTVDGNVCTNIICEKCF